MIKCSLILHRVDIESVPSILYPQEIKHTIKWMVLKANTCTYLKFCLLGVRSQESAMAQIANLVNFKINIYWLLSKTQDCLTTYILSKNSPKGKYQFFGPGMWKLIHRVQKGNLFQQDWNFGIWIIVYNLCLYPLEQ